MCTSKSYKHSVNREVRNTSGYKHAIRHIVTHKEKGTKFYRNANVARGQVQKNTKNTEKVGLRSGYILFGNTILKFERVDTHKQFTRHYFKHGTKLRCNPHRRFPDVSIKKNQQQARDNWEETKGTKSKSKICKNKYLKFPGTGAQKK